MSTHMSPLYLGILIRLHLNSYYIANVHLISVPMYERHTAAMIFDTAAKALDVLCPSWKDSIVGVSTYGKRKMTGRILGVATRFQEVVNPGFFCIWCGARQLDIVIQSAYRKLGGKAFYT